MTSNTQDRLLQQQARTSERREAIRAAELCRQTIARDHRWENLANGLTGGSECV